MQYSITCMIIAFVVARFYPQASGKVFVALAVMSTFGAIGQNWLIVVTVAAMTIGAGFAGNYQWEKVLDRLHGPEIASAKVVGGAEYVPDAHGGDSRLERQRVTLKVGETALYIVPAHTRDHPITVPIHDIVDIQCDHSTYKTQVGYIGTQYGSTVSLRPEYAEGETNLIFVHFVAAGLPSYVRLYVDSGKVTLDLIHQQMVDEIKLRRTGQAA